jgi:hypothetical protein
MISKKKQWNTLKKSEKIHKKQLEINSLIGKKGNNSIV